MECKQLVDVVMVHDFNICFSYATVTHVAYAAFSSNNTWLKFALMNVLVSIVYVFICILVSNVRHSLSSFAL